MITNTDKVKHFWQSRAQDNVSESELTHRDIWQRWLEIEMIKGFLKKSDRVIDVGCGNGYTSKIIASLAHEIVGIDYSEDMIKRAVVSDEVLGEETHSENIIFAVCNVMELTTAKFGLFDVAISERCLINLGSWDDQKQAIANIAAVIKPEGRFLFIEGSQFGRNQLNQFRKSVGLEEMPPVWHNIDFNDSDLLNYLNGYFVLEHRLHFGVYDFISRILHPLIVEPEQPRYDSKINKIAAMMALKRQEFEDISRVLFWVLRKKC